MLIMTAKLNRRRLFAAAAGIVILLAGLVFFLRKTQTAETGSEAPVSVESEQDRIRYLENLGWKVSDAPAEAMQIRIPREPGEVFAHYNALQKSQGFDLSGLAGKNVMRYVYEIENFPGASKVQATLLVYKGRVVGGDLTDPSPDGKVQGLAPQTDAPPALPQS